MPEGPEVRTVVDSLRKNVLGKRLEFAHRSVFNLRRPLLEEELHRLRGLTFKEVSTLGKFFWFSFDHPDLFLGFRLGMSGMLLLEPSNVEPQKHTHVTLRFEGDRQELRYVDPRRFGEVFLLSRAGLIKERARLGFDGLSPEDEKLALVFERVRKSGRSLKDLLLDQTLFAGVGNIYACEALFYASLHPLRLGLSLSALECERLLSAVMAVLHQALSHRGTTFRDFRDGYGQKGEAKSQLGVFQREGLPCPQCGRPVERMVQAGRSTFLCSTCQPLLA